MNQKTKEQTFMMKNSTKLKLFHIEIIMVISLLVGQILGMEWKKKRSKKKDAVYRLTMFPLKLTGKLNPNCI